MRKIIVSEMISIDGYFEAPNHDITWHTVDDNFNQFAVNLMQRLDTIIFGRLTYQLFEEYWPVALKDPNTGPADVKIAQFIEDAKKIVFSKTLNNVTWNNSVLFHDNLKEEVTKLKEQSGKDIVIYGSGTIVRELTKLGLIDEYILIVSPTILGKGTSLFNDIDKLQLKLSHTEKFSNGNVILIYTK